ncbi:hypothetical protein [Pseudomonas sp. DSV-1]|uniref:hypothetical protein n=1 Tax=Pseudomonas sp. DSV-1 TaxID=3112250 RepID=UPI002DBEA45D|nr:hypothetical protein [Pseudomonas sp. DSV-1]MEC4239116.1 hypothetical protein [Pseudomonas sp. DSV-1]
MLISQLLKPFGYLAIKHPYKWVVDWLYPLLLALITITLIVSLSSAKIIVSPGGMTSMILSFVQSLPGFYIAALAAIATFGRLDIDDILPEPTPKVVVKLRGLENTIDLTRRRFLAMLFAFLTGESIAIVFFCIALLSFGPAIYDFTYSQEPIGHYLLIVALFCLFTSVYQMLLATFWGLYYLGYKLQE